MKVSAALLLMLGVLGGAAHADSRSNTLDQRYNHNRYYPAHGYQVQHLPPGAFATRYRGTPYYFSGGAWYRPDGPRFVVVAPPIGIGLNALPPFYTTVWLGGVPYYYADNTYYVWRPDQQLYEVAQPPENADSGTTVAPNNQEVFIYPKNGQSQQQQATDRYDCHSWAAQQTGFDPTQPLGDVAQSQAVSKRADYQRAEAACLESRGYTVR